MKKGSHSEETELRLLERIVKLEKENPDLSGASKLREDFSKYKTIFEISANPVLILDKKGTLIDCSSSLYDFLGYKREELLGENLMSMKQLTSSSKTKAFENFRKRLKGEKIDPYYLEFIAKDGTIHFGKIDAHLLKDTNNNIIGDIIFVSDITELIKTQERVNESATRLKTITELSPAAMFIVKNNHFVFVNTACEKILEYSFEELSKMYFWDVVHPDSRELVKSRGLARQQGSEIPNNYEFKVVSKSGKVKWIDFFVTLIDYQGQPALYGTAFDITERKKMEQDLSEKEINIRNIFEKSTIGLYRANIEGDIIMANDTLIHMLGYETIEDVKKLDFTKEGYIEEGVRQNFIDILDKEGEVRNFENAWKRRDGSIVHFRETARVYKNEDGAIMYFEGSIEDVTERKLAEMRLTRERNLLNSLMDNVPDAIYFKDTKSRFIKINRGALSKYGAKSEDEVLGRTDFDLFTDEHAAQAFADEQKIMETGTPILGMEEKETWPDGSITWVSTSKLPLFDEQGKIIGTFGISRDITNLKETSEYIKNMNEQLKEANQSKDKFFSVIAHDLKSPFTALLGYSEFIVEDYEELTADEIKLYTSNINEVAKNVHDLLQNLLDWSRIQLGRLENNPEVIKLDEVTLRVKELFKNNAEKKNINLDFDIDSGIMVFADLNMVFTILRNLVSNAIKFTDEGGSIKINARENDDSYIISVTDSGIGMIEEDMERLFKSDVFFSKVGTQSEKGTGLGLLLCKDLVELNKGKIAVQSKIGEGTTFTFTLPKTE